MGEAGRVFCFRLSPFPQKRLILRLIPYWPAEVLRGSSCVPALLVGQWGTSAWEARVGSIGSLSSQETSLCRREARERKM